MSGFEIGGLLIVIMLIGVAVGVFFGWMCAKDQVAIVTADLQAEAARRNESDHERMRISLEIQKLQHSNLDMQARINRARDIVYDSPTIRHVNAYPRLRMLLDPESVARDLERYDSPPDATLKISAPEWEATKEEARKLFSVGLPTDAVPAEVKGRTYTAEASRETRQAD